MSASSSNIISLPTRFEQFESKVLDAALDYAKRGWYVIPLHAIDNGKCTCSQQAGCKSPGKHPIIKGWQQEATRDPSLITRWWTNQTWSNSNVGIVTGERSGLVVLDIDPRHRGEETLEELEQTYGKLPGTVECQTGGGGRHLYFAYPNHGERIRNEVARLGPGLDIRADGGFVVAPPSLHSSGREYTWEASSIPGEVELAELPSWILNLIRDSERREVRQNIEDIPRVIVEGQRNSTLTSLAGSLRHRGLAQEVIESTLLQVNQSHCSPPLSEKEVLSIAKSISKYPPGQNKFSEAALVNVASVKAERVHWLWPGRIPFGKVTLLDGDPGLGKSLLTLDLAARVTTGDLMPSGAVSELDTPCGVVLLTAEDDVADTIKPRLEAANADCARIVLLQSIVEVSTASDGTVRKQKRLPRLTDISALEQAIASVDAKLIIVDPLMAFVGSADTKVDSDVRSVLALLAELAQRKRCAVLAVRHLNKTSSSNPLYRGGGSIGFIAACRSGLLIAPDPDDEQGTRRILAVSKSNLSQKAESLAFSIEAIDDVPVIRWLGTSQHSAKSLLALSIDNNDEYSAIQEAKDFLLDVLSDGPLETQEIKQQAKNAAISEISLRRAKSLLGVQATKSGFAHNGKWCWNLPPNQDD